MPSLKKINLPEDVTFKQATEIVSLSFYPIQDKDFKEIKVVKAFRMVLILEITIWMDGFLIPKQRKIIRQKIDNETFNQLIKHYGN